MESGIVGVQSESCRDTLAAVHRTLSSPIAGRRQLRLKMPILEAERVTPVTLISLLGSGFDPVSLWGWCLFASVYCSGFPGYSAGCGVDPAGGASGGG
ncbi:hypothetical protein F511_01159 [Dorcoceras hygrometricum]|nr:hypothetical protein F511_01159 [Dorcoceras hygrometricum]